MKPSHEKERFVEQLLTWYDEHKRILPWRDHPTPYRVWVSEIMLQQTRVEAVKPYYQRFLQALPTLKDLAMCEDDMLAKLWEGLGYYNRVRNMKKCAVICMDQYNGNLPADYDKLLELPGIGAYTAGAIASIAYHIPVSAVDGNVLRVFSRVLYSEDDILKETTKKKFQQIIQSYLPQRCDAFNQALMEIGALICVPNGTPLCHKCPVASECIAYQLHDQKRLPIKHRKKKRTVEQHTVLVMIYDHKVHLIKRPASGLLADLYQFDFLDGFADEETIQAYVESYGSIREILPLSDAVHIFSHKEWHMNGWLVFLQDLSKPNEVWVNAKQLRQSYAVASAFKVYKEACMTVLEGVISFESSII